MRRPGSAWQKVGKTTAVILAAIALYCGALFLLGTQLEKTINAVPHCTVTEDQLSAEIIRASGETEYCQGSSFPELRNGDRMAVTIHSLEEAKDVPDAVLTFSLYHCRVRVYAGEELLYEQDRPLQSEQIGHRFYIVPLPEDYAGDPIRIEAMDCENSSVSTAMVLQAVPGYDAVYSFLRGRITLLLIMFTVLIFSLFLLSGVK